jgi:hypothetical protein
VLSATLPVLRGPTAPPTMSSNALTIAIIFLTEAAESVQWLNPVGVPA